MKHLFVTQYFHPEVFRGNDIAYDWVLRGDSVTVVTAIPNYPKGSFTKGYGIFSKRKEILNGVTVIRVPVIPRGNGSGLQLVLNYFSYTLMGSIYCFFLALFNKYDTIFVQQLSPVTMAIPAVVAKKVNRKPLSIWVLDLWPESLASAGNIKNKHVMRFFELIVKKIYKHSDRIFYSSKGFKASISEKGDFSHKISYLPNWAEKVFTKSEKKVVIPQLPEGFIVLFAGNVGEAQDFENIMNAALQLKDDKKIKFVIVGDGRKKHWVDNFVKQNSLEETVSCLGRYPLEAMPAFFEKADVMLVSLKDEPIFNLTLPAKTQAYMMSGKPIVGMMSGEGQYLIDEAECGLCVNAGDYKALSEKIQFLSAMKKHELEVFGENGKRFATTNFNKSVLLNQLYSEIQSMR